jgi:hypothetical protein
MAQRVPAGPLESIPSARFAVIVPREKRSNPGGPPAKVRRTFAPTPAPFRANPTMKTPPLFLGFCLIVSALPAAAPHPTVLRVKHKDDRPVVVRVHGDDPYVMIDGKETLIRSTPVYFLENADGYASNFVETRGAMGGKFNMKVIGDHYADRASGLVSGTVELNVPMKARKTIKGGFITVAMISNFFLGEIIVHELPELPAGQEVKVKVEVRALPRESDAVYFAQVFDETGREVPTSDMDLAWQYYAQRDRLRLAKGVEMYRKKFPNADHAAVPTFTPSPLFKPDAVLPTGEVIVLLSILEDGTVSNVDAGMIADDSARQSVIDALGGWLFLPKLKAGQPVATFMKVPLQF